MLNSELFTTSTGLSAAIALKKIFARRTHVVLVLGEERRIPGTLGNAVNLPSITRRLEHRSAKQREQALEEFKALWNTLSAVTRNSVSEVIGWYEPEELTWDDKRSNRRPDLPED